jgi:DNA polymerase
MLTQFTGWDYETYGNVNLPKRGLDCYVNGDGFEALIASISHPRYGEQTYDFVFDGKPALQAMTDFIHDEVSRADPLVAHNAGFERAVSEFLGLPKTWEEMVWDSAVIARIQGAASHLEAAAPQLTDIEKLEVGKELIMLFSVPNDRNGGKRFTAQQIMDDEELYEKWQLFKKYCENDAKASRTIAEKYMDSFGVQREAVKELLTARMNQRGWKVDLQLVREMQLRYEHNLAQIESDFSQKFGGVNLNSTQQLVEFSKQRGIATKSFDVDHVNSLRKRVEKKLGTMGPFDKNYQEYSEVLEMLIAKQSLGGTSLKKLQTILDLVGPDGRLRNQYMHAGAGQSYRTTGKGVQMQNLKRLGSQMLTEMEDLYDEEQDFTNDQMGENLRQVFVASSEQGELIVGDFSSVEARGLAWVAGQDDVIKAFHEGKDLYKVQAAKMYNTPYDQVTKDQRQVGKIGVLSCGYGAGKVSVKNFAHGYGVELTEDEAQAVVTDWRDTNPMVPEMWYAIDDAIKAAVKSRAPVEVKLAHKLTLVFRPTDTPKSLLAQHPGAQTISMELWHHNNAGRPIQILERTFQGCYQRGRNVCYYKPTSRKTGDLWSGHFTDPKTKQVKFYDVYGGKLAGILIQSMCRELFFDCLEMLENAFAPYKNVKIVGQFHDEIVVDWVPRVKGFQAGVMIATKEEVMATMESVMSTVSSPFHGFPLAADIKSGYRYIK